MDIVEVLKRAQGGSAFENMGRKVGLDASQTESAAQELAPLIAAGLRRNSENQDGLADLLAALQRGNHERYVRDADTLDDARDEGNRILGHVFGSKDVSRALAAHASDETGIGSNILKQLLPVIASMIMGSMSNRTREPGLQDILGDVLGGALGGGGRGGDGGLLESVLGGILGGGGNAARDVQQRRRDSGRENDSLGLDDLFGDILAGGGRTRSGKSQSTRSGSGSARRGGGSAADDLLEAVLRNTRR